jgi:hypothetical protein
MNSVNRFFIYIVGIVVSMNLISAQTLDPSYIPGPEMNVARMAHQTVLLPNQSLLLIGGHGTSFVSLGSADNFTSVPDTFIIKAMNYVHDGGAVARLANGRLLIAGGAADWGIAPGYNTAEIYNPTNGSFTPTGTMNLPRMLATPAVMKNGKVLIVGGWYDNSSATYGEVYDPSSETFTQTGAENVLRANPILIPTSDSGAVIFSGYPPFGGNIYEQVEHYNSSSNTFSIVRNTLFASPSDSGWIPFCYLNYYGIMDAQQLKDGRYLFIAYKADGDSALYSLFTINPSNMAFELFRTKTALPISKVTSCFAPIVDTAKSVVYLPVQRTDSDPIQIKLFAISLKDSTIAEQADYFTLPSSYYLSGANFNLLPDGRILMSGGHTQTGYNTNFTPHTHTYLITPHYTAAVTSVKQQTVLTPGSFELYQNYPNPFNPTTQISFSLDHKSMVNLKLFDVLGREIKILTSGEYQSGMHTITLDASMLPSGIYFYQLQTGNFTAARKLTLLK